MAPLGVFGRMLGAIIVPILLLIAVSVGITSERRGRVELAESVTHRLDVLEQLVTLRSAVFAERVAAELLVEQRRPPEGALRTSHFGTLILDRPELLEERTDAALTALPPQDRPFAAEELARVRADRATWSGSMAGVRRELGPFFERTTTAIEARLDPVMDTALALGDPGLIEAGRTFHRAVPVPRVAGELLAHLTDLWVAEPGARSRLQSEVADSAARMDEYSTSFLSSIAGQGSLSRFWHGPMAMPDGLDTLIDSVRTGELSRPDRAAARPAEMGLALLEGVDWLLVVEDLPLRAARLVERSAADVRADARTEEITTATGLLLAVGVSIVAALWLGRSIVAPVLRLTDRAQRVGSGQLDAEPLELRGPPEVVRACQAFNDVVDNLLLLERKSHALADCDFDHPSLRQPLPGLLGAELQRSVRVLSGSIVEREQLQSRLVYEATHDSLTGLANRAELVERLAAACRGRDPRRSVALVFLDLDGFKRANDRHGHAAGDELLRVVAQRMRRLVPSRCTVARFGGDEFVVVVPDVIERDEPVALAEALVRAVAEPVDVDGALLTVGASAGVALSKPGVAGEDQDPLDLLRRADLAVYSAKRRGNQDVALYDSELDRQITQQEDVEEALAEALAPSGDELTLVYQPIIDTHSGELHGVESLVRWDRPQHGRVPPDAFVPIAERSGLIVELDRWVMHAALRQVARWSASPQLHGVPVSVNVSGRSLLDPGFVEGVTAALGAAGVSPNLLKIEVTETALVTDLVLAGEQLRKLQDTGVRVVIDDFGTGYTSVAHLRSMPVDELKIDGSFVQRLPDEENRVLIQMIHQLAHQLEIPTVAECVETAEQIRYLREIGCDALQGYLFSRPLEHDELERWVRSRLSGWDLGQLTVHRNGDAVPR